MSESETTSNRNPENIWAMEPEARHVQGEKVGYFSNSTIYTLKGLMIFILRQLLNNILHGLIFNTE